MFRVVGKDFVKRILRDKSVHRMSEEGEIEGLPVSREVMHSVQHVSTLDQSNIAWSKPMPFHLPFNVIQSGLLCGVFCDGHALILPDSGKHLKQ